MKSIIELNELNFDQEVVQSKQPVLVDFWADWCGPCKMLAPILDQIATEQQGQIAIGKVNVDENPGLAKRFKIQGIPTLLFFGGGQLRDQAIGLVSKKTIEVKLGALKAGTAGNAG